MIDHFFTSGQDLLNICKAEDIPISEAAVLYELDREEMDRNAIMTEIWSGVRPSTESRQPTDAISTPHITPGAATAAIANRNVKCATCANVTFRSKMITTASVEAIILMALPTMWTFAHSGTTKSRTSFDTPFFSQHSSVTGMTAEDDAMDRPVK